MRIYHGSQNVIEVPQYGLGKAGNDFGLGFYCTESEDLAKEWSVQPNRDGFANAYDIDGLNILRLNAPDFTVLNWMAILVYEQRRKSINKAEAQSVLRLARALGCEMEDILEP